MQLTTMVVVQRTSFEDMNCSVAQCLEVVGEWWSLLIVRDAFLGVRRFDDFQARLGISRNILNQRLTKLVDEGVLDRVPYQDNPPRSEYRLTDKGRDLWYVLTAMRQWGDRWAAPDGLPLKMRHAACGRICQSGGGVLALRRTARSSFGDRRAGTWRGARPTSTAPCWRALPADRCCVNAQAYARPKVSSMKQLTTKLSASDAVTSEGPRASVVFAVTALGAFMAALDLSIVNVAFPDLEASYPRASQAALAWVITAYSIVFGALLVTGGRTGDRIGRRRTFMAGLAVFVVGSFLCGIAPNVPMLVASRVLQGAGAAFLVPASVALLIGAYPAERRTQMVALWGGIGALAVATGPSLGAAIVSAGGWRWAFFVNVPIGAALLVLARRTAERIARRPPTPPVPTTSAPS